MALHSWLQNLRSALTSGRGRQHRRPPGASTHRPHFEVLEDRLTPSFAWLGSFPIDQFPAAAMPAPQPPLLADFTSDGILDQITNGWHTVEGSPVNEVVVRPGRGDGTFGDPISSDAPNASSLLAVADFNGDGRLDVFTADPAD